MDGARVVAVQDPTGGAGRGSGYVIGPRLVLTSAHAVPACGATVQVMPAAARAVCHAVVAWRGTAGGRDDAALVEVDDPSWRPPVGRVRWGRVVTNRPGTACQAWGFPDFVQREGRTAETAQPSGTLNPGDRYVGDRYVMTLEHPPPTPPAEGGSPWGGLSGAGLFCGDLLTGVAAADPAGTGHSRIEAVPMYLLTRQEGFRAVLARHDLGEPVLEPVELQDLADVEPDLVASPAGLLRARRQVTAFRGREQLLTDLSEWARGPGFTACLLHGPGGQGKTRLAQELAGRLACSGDRWAWLWLTRDAPAEHLGVLADAAVPLLVIVDYAETRPAQVAAVARAAARHTGSAPLRLLLLARTAGDWWTDLQASDGHTAELLDAAPTCRLDELDPEPADRHDAYRQAVTEYAAALRHLPGRHHHDWPAIAARLAAAAAAQTSWPGPATALTVHITALADLLDTADPATARAAPGDGRLTPAGPGRVEDRLLAHERGYWKRTATTAGLLPALSLHTLTDALVAAFLLDAADPDTADALLRRVPALADQPRDRRDHVRRWIAHLYPPGDPTRPWAGLQPDRLAERFVGTHLTDHPHLADHLATGADPDQATHLLTVYARAAAQPGADPHLTETLTRLCTHHPDTLAVPAIQVATQVETPHPLLTALRQLTDDPHTPPEFLTTLNDRLPHTSHRLAPWAGDLARRLTDHHRRLTADNPDLTPDLATALNNLGNRLSNLGRREDALAATGEAATLYRRLAAERPDAFTPDLASAVNNLGIRLSDLGRREDALAATGEAADLYRRLAAERPDAFTPDLATAVNNLGMMLSNLGRREEALAAAEEAVTLRRRLAADRPDAFTPDLASSLNNLGIRLSELGRREEALAATGEAADLYRRLAAERPDAFTPDLAMSVNNLGMMLSELGRREEALAAADEAVTLRRRLAADRPDAFTPDLASSLNNLGLRLSDLGRREEALAATGEAVEIRRRLAAERPDAFTPDLASSLNNLGNRLSKLGRREEALAATGEAADLYRRLAAERPDAFTPDLAKSLNNLSVMLSDLGRREEALAAAGEAVTLRRRLAAERPDAFTPDLAMAVNNLGIRLSDLGRREEALAATGEAADLYRRLAADRPDAFTPDLATAVNNLGGMLSNLGRREEALAATGEAADLYRRLAAERPDAFTPDLATAVNNLGGMLSNLGRREEALAATGEAADLYRRLAADRPDAFTPDLATAVNNLGMMLSNLGRREEALAATGEAVTLRRRLAADRPDAFTPDLASSLNNLGIRLSDLGRREDALAATGEAADLYRRLAAERPDAFTPDLASAVNNLGIRLSDLGRREDALAATGEAADLYRRLAAERPDAFTPDLAMAVNNLSVMLSDLGRREEALAATREAVEIRRRLAAQWPDVYTDDLKRSLDLLRRLERGEEDD